MSRVTKADARRLERSMADLAAHLDGMDRRQVEVLWPKVRRRYREMFPNGAWTARAVLKHWTRLIKEVRVD